jgi:hypothetical protein
MHHVMDWGLLVWKMEDGFRCECELSWGLTMGIGTAPQSTSLTMVFTCGSCHAGPPWQVATDGKLEIPAPVPCNGSTHQVSHWFVPIVGTRAPDGPWEERQGSRALQGKGHRIVLNSSSEALLQSPGWTQLCHRSQLEDWRFGKAAGRTI